MVVTAPYPYEKEVKKKVRYRDTYDLISSTKSM